MILTLVLPLLFGACKNQDKKIAQSEQETQEREATKAKNSTKSSLDWKVLFDGTSFDGWQLYGGGEVPPEWKLEDGAMVFYPPEKRPKGAQYNINTVHDFTNFELSLEWRISKNGNSGVFWGIHEDPEEAPYKSGPEIQVLDNKGHPDSKAGKTHQAGALYDMVAPIKDTTKPVGEWNTMVLYVNYAQSIGHVDLNGERIVDFPLDNQEWNNLVAKSKFADWAGFGTYKKGKIGVQDHGDVVAFRNIKIKEL